MKSLITITILALIVVASAVSHSRKSRKHQTSNGLLRSLKSKSHDMKQDPTVYMFLNNNEKVLLKAQLLVGSVSKPDSFPEAGIVFNSAVTPTGDFLKFVLKNNNRYFIPFRFISSTCKADYVSGYNYKYERFGINVDGQQFNLGLRNEYHTFGEELSQDSMQKICNWINLAADAMRNAIGGIKTNLNQESSVYKTNKESLDAAKGGVEGLKTQLAKATADKAQADNLMVQAKAKYVAQTAKIGAQSLVMAELESNLKNMQQNIDNINSQDKALELQIKALTTQVSSGSANTGNFQTQFDASKNAFVADIGKLKLLAPQPGALQSADAASAALLNNNDPKLVNTNLKKITP